MLNRNVLIALSALSLVFSLAQPAEAAITSAAAAELACHRIERLALLKKADSTFLTQLEKLTVQVAADSASFKVLGEQTAAPGSKASAIELLFDAGGKFLSFTQTLNSGAQTPQSWPTEPVTMIENALHYLERNETNPEIAPFSASLSTVALAAFRENATDLAHITIQSMETSKKLVLVESLDGVVMSYSVVE